MISHEQSCSKHTKTFLWADVSQKVSTTYKTCIDVFIISPCHIENQLENHSHVLLLPLVLFKENCMECPNVSEVSSLQCG